MLRYTLKNDEVLQIRYPAPKDAKNLLAYLRTVGKETDNLTFGEEGLETTLEQEEKFIEQILTQKNSTMLLGLVKGKIVSVGNLTGQSRRRLQHNAELGISVLKEYWNQGVGTWMMKALIDFARASSVIRIIRLKVRSDHESAISLYHKLGFVDTGIFPKQIYIDGVYYDTTMMNLEL